MPLWRDIRVLKWAVQLAVVALVAAFVIWLYGNYTTLTSLTEGVLHALVGTGDVAVHGDRDVSACGAHVPS